MLTICIMGCGNGYNLLVETLDIVRLMRDGKVILK